LPCRPLRRRSMPSLPNGCKSLSTEEIFPRSLQAHTLQLQLRQLAQDLAHVELCPLGEVVYMSWGLLVQKSPQPQALFVDHLLVGVRPDRLVHGLAGEARVDLPAGVVHGRL